MTRPAVALATAAITVLTTLPLRAQTAPASPPPAEPAATPDAPKPRPSVRDDKRRTMKDYVAVSAESDAWSKDLKKRGFSFVGPTTCYAFMQAMGLVNDHYAHCDCRGPCETERKKLKRPAKVSPS